MHTEFFKPTDLGKAIELLGQYNDKAVIVNGGTDIVIDIAQKKINPEAIIYIEEISELQGISERKNQIVLGGAVTYLQMQKSPICRKVTGLMEALSNLGSPAIRAVATPAGNVCTAAPSADCTTMLMALKAKIVLTSIKGERIVPIKDLFAKSYKTIIEPNEIIREIYFSVPKKGDGTGYCRLARRKSQDIGKILVSATLHVENGICTDAAIGLGAVNETAVRGTSVEQSLIGKTKQQALEYVKNNFPDEARLRASYFKHYKELVMGSAIGHAVDMAWNDAEGVK